jgi:acetolactate synthase-1/2/3 large subunit
MTQHDAGRGDGDTTAAAPITVAQHVAELLGRLGVREAYGVCGREIVPVWSALLGTRGTEHEIATVHTRHENGAGFAAIGSWAQTVRPVAVFVTTGPGLTNVITSLETARATGAKLVLLSPLTPAAERGRLGIQATGPGGYANPDLYAAGRLFDLVAVIESPDQLATLAGPIAAGLAGEAGFCVHIAIPTAVQTAPAPCAPAVPRHRRITPGLSPAAADELVELLAEGPFGVWVGWGARAHAARVRRLLDLTGAPAICSPRALGVVDTHPSFIGVTGNGGRESVPDEIVAAGLRRILVLGSALGEATSGWQPGLVPPDGFVHVDIDPTVFGTAYPAAPTVGVQADIGELLDALLARADRLTRRPLPPRRAPEQPPAGVTGGPGSVHPAALMEAIQRVIVERTDIPVFADASSAMFWGARHLVFGQPGRWFVEGRFGSMGSAGAAVVGAASGRGGPAAAICGDGSLHMQDEINTAVHYGLRAIWIVLNDGGLGIVRAGMRAAGWPRHDADYPATDFAAVARAKGADAVRVTAERELDAALLAALEADGPFLVDVLIDPTAAPPIGARTKR